MTNPLEQAYHDLKVNEPLKPGDPRLCKILFTGFLTTILERLRLETDSSPKILVSGHTGCGKSTFLNYLIDCPEIRQRYTVIRYSILDVLNPEDITHTDLLVSVGISALEQANQKGFKLEKRFAAEIVELAKLIKGQEEIEKITEETKAKGLAIDGGISLAQSQIESLTGSFKLSYMHDKTVRMKTRELVQGKTQDLIQRINALLAEVRLAKRLPVLVLIDDTDKIALKFALEIFNDHGLDIANLNATAIFAVNMDVVCSGWYKAIVTKVGYGETFPAIKVYNRLGETSEDTAQYRESMASMLEKRIARALTEERVIEELALLSGGVTREAVRIANYAVFNALVNNRSQVTMTDVITAKIKLRNEYNLTRENNSILRDILLDPQWQPSDEELEKPDSYFLKMVHTLMVLEYRNAEDKWRRPNPVLVDLIRK